MSEAVKLHLGCGNEILKGYINLDAAELPGVDKVHDLNKFPWPFSDNSADEILTKHVVEHLPNTIQVMEEFWRICKNGAKLIIRVPFWNSEDFITDPTHIKAFNQFTFEFFDPTSRRCQERPYYSTARFEITKRTYFIRILGRYLEIHKRIFQRPLEILAGFFGNIIFVMEFELKAVK